MKNLKELEQKYLELGKEIEALKRQNTEKEEFNYPICCKLKDSSLVVKFTGLQSGEVVINEDGWNVGESSIAWTKHTNKNEWQQLEVCKKTGFFDGQLVWCWDDTDSHIRFLKFYDAKNKCTYEYSGRKWGYNYKNYEPFKGNFPDWALEAFQTLER
jgi:hypothetical protein